MPLPGSPRTGPTQNMWLKHLIPIDIIITYTLLDIGTTPDQDPYFKSGSVTNNPGGKKFSLNTGIF